MGMVAGGLVLTAVTAYGFAGHHPMAVMVLAIAGLGSFALGSRRGAACLIVVLAATIVPDEYGLRRVAGISSDPAELVVLASLGGLAVSRLVTPHKAKSSSFAFPLAVIISAVAVGSAVGWRNGADHHLLVGQMKAYLWYLLPLVFASAFPGTQDRAWLARWLRKVAIIGSVGFILLIAAHQSHILAQYTNGTSAEGSGAVINTLGVLSTAQRYEPPILTLVVLAMLLSVADIGALGASPYRIGEVSLYVIVMGLSFNRSLWLPLLLSSVFLFTALSTSQIRILRTAVIGLPMVAILALGADAGALGPTAHAVYVRGARSLSGKVTRDPTYIERVDEIHSAERAITHSPLVGTGLGRGFGFFTLYFDSATGNYRLVERTFTHNGFFEIWLQLGMLGLTGFLLLGAAIVSTVPPLWRKRAGLHAGPSLAAVLAIGTLAFESLLRPTVISRPVIVVLALSLTLIDADLVRGGRMSP